MLCYNCGFEAEADVCPNCGAPLATYRHISALSAAYYNDGLDRARSRDLDGAERALKMCLRLDKNNIDARNLLGLIFYETGEAVHAITQWVVSKNLRQEGNYVDHYLDELRSSPDHLDTMNKAIKKYNFALRCARRGSLDMAMIQLKKALQLNPRLLKARELLSLLYIRREDYARARHELTQCSKIDAASDKTIRYQKEIDRIARMKASAREEEKPKKKGILAAADTVEYRNGNDTVIQPAHRFGTGGALSLISVFAGLAVGMVATILLVVPAAGQRARLESMEKVAAISEEMDAKTSRLTEYEREVSSLEQQQTQLQYQLDAYEGRENATGSMEGLMNAAALYLAGEADIEVLASQLEVISAEEVEASPVAGYKALYDEIVKAVGPDVSDYYFDRGATAVRSEDYALAVRMYGLAAQFDPENENALYNYAEATRLSGDETGAKLLYDKVISNFSGSSRASEAAARIAELNN